MQPEPDLAGPALLYLTASAPVLALRLDAHHRVVAINTHAQRILGPEVLGRLMAELVLDFTPLPDLNVADTTGATAHLLSLHTAASSPESYYFRFFSLPEGSLAIGSTDFGEQERLRTVVLGLNRDLNDLTRQLHLANAELRELNQLKNLFLGMAAHDLRRPLGVVMAYAEFVLDEAGSTLSAEHREFLRTCLSAALDMKRLIDGFLDLAVVESGKLRLDLAPATAADILTGALEISRLIAARKRVELLVAAPASAPLVRVDAPKLQQVLTNLIGNAVEHSRSGQRVWVSSHQDKQGLRFTVRDEGPGILPENRVRLFEPFETGGTRKTAGERSVGLGLVIARKIIEAHRGSICVESAPGCGATFSVSLPAEPEADLPTTQTSQP